LINAVGAMTEKARADGDLREEIDPEALTELAMTVFEGLQARAQSETFVTSHERVADTFLQLLALGAAPDGSRYRKTLLVALRETAKR
jgi:hypothetical protein